MSVGGVGNTSLGGPFRFGGSFNASNLMNGGVFGLGSGQAGLGLANRINPFGLGNALMGGGAYPGMGNGGMGGGMPQGSPGMAGGGGGGAAGMGTQVGQETQPVQVEDGLSRVLTATGVPFDNGRLRWPQGLTILAAPGADQLREQIGALFQVAMTQPVGAAGNAEIAQEMSKAVSKLRRMLLKDKAERHAMPLALYEESERFLNRLSRAEQIVKASLGVSSGEAELKAAEKPSPDATPVKQEK